MFSFGKLSITFVYFYQNLSMLTNLVKFHHIMFNENLFDGS